jgi:hypothetical protein
MFELSVVLLTVMVVPAARAGALTAKNMPSMAIPRLKCRKLRRLFISLLPKKGLTGVRRAL